MNLAEITEKACVLTYEADEVATETFTCPVVANNAKGERLGSVASVRWIEGDLALIIEADD